MSEEFLNWCEGKWENEFKAQRLFSKLSSEDIDFLKDQYKADMIAMLTEIQLEIEELWDNDPSYIEGVHDSEMVVQQKIDKLKENK